MSLSLRTYRYPQDHGECRLLQQHAPHPRLISAGFYAGSTEVRNTASCRRQLAAYHVLLQATVLDQQRPSSAFPKIELAIFCVTYMYGPDISWAMYLHVLAETGKNRPRLTLASLIFWRARNRSRVAESACHLNANAHMTQSLTHGQPNRMHTTQGIDIRA